MATAAETAALRTSFRQEVAVWHKLDHPNVTKVLIFFLNWFRTFQLLIINTATYLVSWFQLNNSMF